MTALGRSKKNLRRSPCQGGFTLIEMMVASAFFLALLSAIFTLQVTSARMLQKSRSYDKASALLLDMSELFQVMTPEKLQAFLGDPRGQTFTQDGAPTPNSSPDVYFTLVAALVPNTQRFQQVAVTVYWHDQDDPTQRSVTSDMLVNLP